eukprot:Rhum_TRINITY_DN14524_c11_g1::Rhum_TRINITY_DN14524_c11_g1_i1::g.96682::m.96682
MRRAVAAAAGSSSSSSLLSPTSSSSSMSESVRCTCAFCADVDRRMTGISKQSRSSLVISELCGSCPDGDGRPPPPAFKRRSASSCSASSDRRLSDMWFAMRPKIDCVGPARGLPHDDSSDRLDPRGFSARSLLRLGAVQRRRVHGHLVEVQLDLRLRGRVLQGALPAAHPAAARRAHAGDAAGDGGLAAAEAGAGGGGEAAGAAEADHFAQAFLLLTVALHTLLAGVLVAADPVGELVHLVDADGVEKLAQHVDGGVGDILRHVAPMKPQPRPLQTRG